MASFCIEYELQCPHVTREQIFVIKQAFHPLSKLLLTDKPQVKNNYFSGDIAKLTASNPQLRDLIGDFVVSGRQASFKNSENDIPDSQTWLEDSLVNPKFSNKLCLLTAPNYSGKSFYSKIVSLAIYLAHTGLFTNTEKSLIGLTDRIIFIGNSYESV
jgi:hypothetical protein